MRPIALTAFSVAATLALLGPAFAADMTGAEIKAFLSGKTVYTETTTASASGQAGQTTIYWGDDGNALLKAPNGSVLQGKWQIKGDTLCTAWQGRPELCTKYAKDGDVVTVTSAANGTPIGKVAKTAPGNAEKLAP